MYNFIYNLLQYRPFCNCSKQEQKIYNAYCGRVAETICNKIEEIIKEGEKEEILKSFAKICSEVNVNLADGMYIGDFQRRRIINEIINKLGVK